jgi:hypothetical protein
MEQENDGWQVLNKMLCIPLPLRQTSTTISTGINIDYGVQFDPLLNVGVNDVSASLTAGVAAVISFGGHLLGPDEMVCALIGCSNNV